MKSGVNIIVSRTSREVVRAPVVYYTAVVGYDEGTFDWRCSCGGLCQNVYTTNARALRAAKRHAAKHTGGTRV